MRYVSPDAEERECPFCDAPVLVDNAQHALHHLAPICAGWDRLMKQLGERSRTTTVVAPKGQA